MSKRVTKTLLSGVAAIAIAMITLPSHEAKAQDKARAEQLNDTGKGLFKERRYLEAYRAFKQATELSPEGRFYFNLCFSLNYLERFQEAIDACEQVEPNGADQKLLDKTAAVLGALRSKVPSQPPPDPNTNQDPNNQDPNNQDPNNQDPNNQDPNNQDPNNQDPNNQDPNNQDPSNTGPATVPGFDPFAEKKAPEGYKWSVGAGIAALGNGGLGRKLDLGVTGEANRNKATGNRFNLFSDFIVNQTNSIGVRGYLGLTTIPEKQMSAGTLTVADFGLAAYKHFTIAENLEVTPLAGLQFSLYQISDGENVTLTGFGARAEVGLGYALGRAKEHVFSVVPAVNFYGAARGDEDSFLFSDAEFYGLDTASATLEIGLSYRYRFTTPFGTGRIFTLE